MKPPPEVYGAFVFREGKVAVHLASAPGVHQPELQRALPPIQSALEEYVTSLGELLPKAETALHDATFGAFPSGLGGPANDVVTTAKFDAATTATVTLTWDAKGAVFGSAAGVTPQNIAQLTALHAYLTTALFEAMSEPKATQN